MAVLEPDENGWNYIKLDFADAGTSGDVPDMENLNWFRIYHAKNGTMTTRIDDIKFIGADGVYIPEADPGPNIVKTDNNENGNELITLDASRSIDFDGSINSYSWVKEDLQIATGVNPSVSFDIGTHIVILTVTDNDGNTDEDQIMITVKPEIDDCDSKAGWQSANTLTVNSIDQKRGSGCLQSEGSNSHEFYKHFLWPLSADSSTALGFWYYISDVSQLESDNQVELGSGGEADVNEYSWSLDSLKNGWNYVILNFSEAVETGGTPDLNAINWFRIYRSKSGAVTARIDDIKFRGIGGNQAPVADAGSGQTVISDSSGNGTVTLDGSGSFDTDGTIADYSWTEADSTIATGVKPVVTLSEGIHVITLTITDDDGATHDDEVTITVDGGYFDDCDAMTDWNSANSLSINTVDQKQGFGCLETVGSSTDDFKKVFSESFSATSFTSFEFWYYVSDVSKLNTSNQVEISSAGRPDMNEYHWGLSNLENGWNYITLNFSEAGITGNAPDLKKINFFRLYRFKSEDVTSRIDGLKFTGVNESPVAVAGPDQTISDADGNGTESVILDGSGSADSDGSIVGYSWINDGSEIATGVNPTVNLPTGEHTITLTVTDNGGATADDELTITIEPSTAIEDEDQMPTKFTLKQNYPNPFNPSTMIKYGIPEFSHVKIEVFNLIGQSVGLLENSAKQPGYHKAFWNAGNLPSGIYIISFKTNSKLLTKKMLLLR